MLSQSQSTIAWISLLLLSKLLIITMAPLSIQAATLRAAVVSETHYETRCLDPYCHRFVLSKFNQTKQQQGTHVADIHRRAVKAKNAALSSRQMTIMTDNSKMLFTIQCIPLQNKTTTDTFCDKVAHAFKSAGDRLMQVIQLEAQIQVSATIYNFCTGDSPIDDGLLPQVSCQSTLGWATPSNFFPIKRRDESVPSDFVVYPHALARQVAARSGQKTTPAKLQQADITTSFNSAYQEDFYFTPEVVFAATGVKPADASIQKTQFDFEYVALHELVHGLGMISMWDTYIADLPDNLKSQIASLLPDNINANDLLSPQITTNDAQTKILDVGPITIFDYGLSTIMPMGESKRWADLVLGSIAPFLIQGQDRDLAYKAFRAMLDGLISPLSLGYVFNTEDNTQGAPDKALILESGLPYQRGSSIVHVSMDLNKNTEEFLMRPEVENGISLQSKMKTISGPLLPFGRETVKMLEDLGYDLTDRASYVLQNSLPSYASRETQKMTWQLIIPLMLAMFLF